MSLLRIVPPFALAALVIAMVPGQGVAMVLRQTIVGGAHCAYTSVLGNSVGLLVWGTLSAVGLSQVFERSHLAFNILKFAGVAYLSFLSVQTLFELRHGAAKFEYGGQARVHPFAAFRLGDPCETKSASHPHWVLGGGTAVAGGRPAVHLAPLVV
jgi:threonine/homoserine/homoserine lactone efflux protein